MTADHNVLNEGCESRNNHRYSVVVQDVATQWIQSYTCKTKTSQETERSLRKFLEPSEKPKVICTDNSLEFGKSWKCSQFSTRDRMYITQTLYTNIVPSLFVVSFPFVHRQRQLSCTTHSLTSVSAHRTWIEQAFLSTIVFSEKTSVVMTSYTVADTSLDYREIL